MFPLLLLFVIQFLVSNFRLGCISFTKTIKRSFRFGPHFISIRTNSFSHILFQSSFTTKPQLIRLSLWLFPIINSWPRVTVFVLFKFGVVRKRITRSVLFGRLRLFIMSRWRDMMVNNSRTLYLFRKWKHLYYDRSYMNHKLNGTYFMIFSMISGMLAPLTSSTTLPSKMNRNLG